VAVRRWRRNLRSAAVRAEMAAFRRALSEATYDRVIDVQGLAKSAVITRLARGERHGLDRASAREWIATFAYQRRHAVSWQLDAVRRNRQLVGDALGYVPRGAPDYGISAEPADFEWLPAAPYCVFLTGTTDAAKLWPEERWGELGRMAGAAGMGCVLPAGTQGEHQRALRIARAINEAGGPPAVAAPSLGLAQQAQVLAGASLAVGVDTGLTHLAGALGRPTVGIFCGTSPSATGVIAARACNVGDVARTPTSGAVWEAASAIAELPATVPVP
jgi:heptosyltransferase-1